MAFNTKYLKYKNKYLNLKNQIGSGRVNLEDIEREIGFSPPPPEEPTLPVGSGRVNLEDIEREIGFSPPPPEEPTLPAPKYDQLKPEIEQNRKIINDLEKKLRECEEKLTAERVTRAAARAPVPESSKLPLVSKFSGPYSAHYYVLEVEGKVYKILLFGSMR